MKNFISSYTNFHQDQVACRFQKRSVNSILSLIGRAKMNLKHGNFFNINFSNNILCFLKSVSKTPSIVKFSHQ